MGVDKNFDLDLLFGEAGEKYVFETLRAKIEVKTDRKIHMTGNICIEHHCRGVPSGILTTQALWWAYKIHETGAIIFVTVKRIKGLIDIGVRSGLIKNVRGGDDNESEIFLIPTMYLLFGGVSNGETVDS
jgi:hypothetical protein